MRRSLLVSCPLSLVSCLIVVLGLAATAQEPKATDNGQRTADNGQTFVFCPDARPVLMRLQIQVDGKPLGAAWDDFTQHLFQALDTDKNGVLSKEEVERMPSPQVLVSSDFFGDFAPPVLSAVDTHPADGKVTKDELARYLGTHAPAFQVQFGQNQGQEMFFDPRGGIDQTVLADALNEALFAKLDTNKDAKLSRDELTAAATVLIKVDEDEDEMLVAQELLPNYNQLAGRNRGEMMMAQPGQKANPKAPFLMVNPDDSPSRLARGLLARYAPKEKDKADRKLGRKEIGLDPATFDRLDADQDELLDTEELARFFRRGGDLELVVRLGKVEGREALLDQAAAEKPAPLAGVTRKSAEGGLVVDLGPARMDLRADGDRPTTNYFGFGIRQFYKQQFAVADKDNNGILDEKENSAGFFRQSFKALDRNGDGKVTEKELDEFIDLLEDLQNRAQVSRASLSIQDQGRGLFDLIDVNRDGRLGVRELRNAVSIVDHLGKDGQIGKGEFPRTYRLTCKLGPGGANRFGAFAAMARYGQDTGPELTAGPLWFRKMDRNRDGDVSRKEFVGPPGDFGKIDADNDALISIEEADRFDGQLRKDKKGP